MKANGSVGKSSPDISGSSAAVVVPVVSVRACVCVGATV